VRIIWFEGPANRANLLLKKEAENGKKVVPIHDIKEYEENVMFRDVFDGSKRVFVILDEIDSLDSKIHSSCSDWSDNDLFIFINRKRTSWSKCCASAKKQETMVEVPFKFSVNKAEQLVRSRMNIDLDDGWIVDMVVKNCMASSWSKEVDAERLEMILSMLEIVFAKRKPRDKADLGCALGYHASEMLTKVTQAYSKNDAVDYMCLHETISQLMSSNMHTIQAVSSSMECKNAKLNLLKSSNASNDQVMAFKKNDGSSLWNQFMVNKFHSNDNLPVAYANFLATCEAASIVPYSSWGSLAWISIMLYKQGSISASEMSKIISAYKSARKEVDHVSGAR